jgi:SAM-dependent methyltransferase
MADIYSIPEFYDSYHHWKTNDIDFILKWAETVGDPILELAAGTGRLAVPLLEKGYEYCGIDSSEAFVTWAQKKISPFAEQGTVLVEDMRDFKLNRKYNFIFIGFNSILHLLNDSDIHRCFNCVKNHLQDGGKFLIDVFVPHTEFLYRDPDKYYDVGSYTDLFGRMVIVKEKNRFDRETEINHITWYVHVEDEPSPQVYEFDMHILYPDTLDRLLAESGFKIEHKFGSYDEDKLNPDSDLQIYVSSL